MPLIGVVRVDPEVADAARGRAVVVGDAPRDVPDPRPVVDDLRGGPLRGLLPLPDAADPGRRRFRVETGGEVRVP
ncbi:hypothetical protein OG422_17715 [Streptomyces sp. NBC_01525]|uniref:hypothetical protein n=1 Tax=Streptomyces TaxID=1883 RepID=UPI002035A48B|nr:hypothetical protein [Streptomyces benahoarensis]